LNYHKANSKKYGFKLFSKIRRGVMVNSDQAPEYAGIRKAGHDGGDFLLVRRK